MMSALSYPPPSVCNDSPSDDNYRISSLSRSPRPRRRKLLPTIWSSLVVIISSLLAASYTRRSSSSSAAMQQQQRPGGRRRRRTTEQRHLQQHEGYIEGAGEEEAMEDQQRQDQDELQDQEEQEDEEERQQRLKRERLQRERRGQKLEGDVLNVYSKGGCLYQKVHTNNKRVCTSEDPPEHAVLGYCIDPSRSNTDPSISGINPNGSGGISHMEIRIYGQNWESVFFESWLLQIVLSEMLHVPTSIETGLADVNVDFYNRDNRFEYGFGDDWSCLITGSQIGDCRNIVSTNDTITTTASSTSTSSSDTSTTSDSYQSCCHFVPENWNGFTEELKHHEKLGTIEAATGIGTIGEEHWFIPKFTAERDPTLLSYVGLAGDENRPKLASRFQTPLTWYEYCTQISTSNCTIPDDVAQRPPKTPLLPAFTTTLSTTLSSSFNNTTTVQIDDVDIIDTNVEPDVDIDESNHYYKEGLYTGYFHVIPNNDCELNPANCTGHIVDYPCGWSSFVIPTTYHLNIALQSNGKNQGASRGYYYNEMVEIILASNATKSDIIIMWWTPEALYQQFLGTDMEFTRVTLPPVTPECMNNRVNDEQRCSDDLETRVGDPLGSCDEPPIPILKITGGWLYEATFGNHTPVALQSPAYDVLRSFRVSGAEVGEMFEYWRRNPTDPRDGICQWAIDNIEKLQSFIPRHFPRVLRDESKSMREPLSLAAVVFGTIATVCVVITTCVTYIQRDRRVMQHSQVEFLWLLLAGLLLVSLASIMSSIPQNNAICIAAVWMTNVGYSLELTPLIVKMAAFYRLLHAARRMRHAKLKRRKLFGAVFLLTLIVVVYLILWTVLDPPLTETEYVLTDEKTGDGETIIAVAYFCNSKSAAWNYASVGWHMALLIAATIQAVQTRKMRKEVNESQTLSIMIYSHFVFVILRLVTVFLEDTMSGTDTMYVRSLIFSLDAIATINIYFVPKFFISDNTGFNSEYFVESSTVRQLQMLAAIATNQHERQLAAMQAQQAAAAAAANQNTINGHSNNAAAASAGNHHPKSLNLDDTQKKKLKHFLHHHSEIEEATNRFADDPSTMIVGEQHSNGGHDNDDSSNHHPNPFWQCPNCNCNERVCAKCGERAALINSEEEDTEPLSSSKDTSSD